MANNSRFAIVVHTLALLADCEGTPLKSEAIACMVKTNPVVIRRLMCDLSKANLIESQSGANGGTWLKRPASEISLWEIYRAVETGEVFSLHRPVEETACQVSNNIGEVLREVQTEVESAIEKSLSQIKLLDILHKVKKNVNEEECPKAKLNQNKN